MCIFCTLLIFQNYLPLKIYLQVTLIEEKENVQNVVIKKKLKLIPSNILSKYSYRKIIKYYFDLNSKKKKEMCALPHPGNLTI